MKKKKIIIAVAAVLIVSAAAAGGIWWWKYASKNPSDDTIVYVSTVAELNAAHPDLSALCFGGVTEAQETKDIKVDLTKELSEVYVQEGDTVTVGTPLFSYDVEAMQLDLEQGQIEAEQMQNEIASYQEQIGQLESEKAKADAEQQISYTVQIQTLQTSISKIEYEIKVKNVELQKQQNAIEHATVTADMDGVVKTARTPEALQADGTDVLLTITASGNYRIKGTLSEQQLGQMIPGQNVIVRSRIHQEQYWTGIVTELGTEAEQNNNDMYYGSTENMASRYPFYIELNDAADLLLGQHVLIEPDMGQNSGHDGIWIYSDYLVWEEDTAYVWASDENDRLYKQKVETGETDDAYGITEIKSGLTEMAKIAYPAEDYENGMKTTTHAEQAVSSGSEEEILSEDDMMYEENIPEDEMAYAEEAVMPEENAADEALLQ